MDSRSTLLKRKKSASSSTNAHKRLRNIGIWVCLTFFAVVALIVIITTVVLYAPRAVESKAQEMGNMFANKISSAATSVDVSAQIQSALTNNATKQYLLGVITEALKSPDFANQITNMIFQVMLGMSAQSSMGDFQPQKRGIVYGTPPPEHVCKVDATLESLCGDVEDVCHTFLECQVYRNMTACGPFLFNVHQTCSKNMVIPRSYYEEGNRDV